MGRFIPADSKRGRQMTQSKFARLVDVADHLTPEQRERAEWNKRVEEKKNRPKAEEGRPVKPHRSGGGLYKYQLHSDQYRDIKGESK